MNRTTRPTEQDDIDMLNDETRWPVWPLLPVKRRAQGTSGGQEVGTITKGDKAGSFVLIHCNMFTIIEATTEEARRHVESFKHTTYLNAQAVLNDGWRVD